MSESTQPPATEQPIAAAPEGDAPAGPSKSELKKRAKAEEKAKKAAAAAAKLEEERKQREAADSVDNASQNYGKQPLHQSQERLGMSITVLHLTQGREYLEFSKITDADVGKEVVFRARLHNMRPQGENNVFNLTPGAKIVFLTFRQQTETIQGVLVASKDDDPHQVSKQMLKYAQQIPVSTGVELLLTLSLSLLSPSRA